MAENEPIASATSSGFLRARSRWLAFAAVVPLDALIFHSWPPGGFEFGFGAALVISLFANLVLMLTIAPWIVRRLPDGETGELVGAIVLLVALVGVLALGLGSREVVVSETNRTEKLGRLVTGYFDRLGNAELSRNLEAANTHDTDQADRFRTCVPYDDRTRAYCVYVEPAKNKVKPDSDGRPNIVFFDELPK